MNIRVRSALFCFGLLLIGFTRPALADSIARYECNVVGFFTQEPIGDRPGHTLSVLDFSCVAVDGLLKGAVYTGSNTVEWDGPKGRLVAGGGIHRIPGGRMVTQLTEGASSMVTKDGKPVGIEASGKGVAKFASGSFAALSGKLIKFTSTPVSPIRFVLEFVPE